MVGDARLREIVGADLGAAVAGRDLRAALGAELGLLLLALLVVEPRAQHLQRLRPVLDLRALVLACDDQPGRKVRDSHRRVGGVDALPAGAAGAVDVHAQVLLLDLDVDVLDLGKHRHGRGRGVDAARGLGRGHALHAMDATLELHLAVDALAREREHHLLEAADRARASSRGARRSASTCGRGRRRTARPRRRLCRHGSRRSRCGRRPGRAAAAGPSAPPRASRAWREAPAARPPPAPPARDRPRPPRARRRRRCSRSCGAARAPRSWARAMRARGRDRAACARRPPPPAGRAGRSARRSGPPPS